MICAPPPFRLGGLLLTGALLACASREDAPFIVLPPTAPMERAYASDVEGWAARLARVEGLGAGVQAVGSFSPGLEPAWTTDEWVFGMRGRKPAALLMPGTSRLSTWAERELPARGIDLLRLSAEQENSDARFDQGGNVIASPPVPGHFPQGRLIVGRDMGSALKDFFRAQRAQTGTDGGLIEIDTSWLKVGHIDEILAFLPGPDGRFRLALPDPLKGLELLSEVPPDQVLFAGAGAAESVGKIVEAGPRFFEDSDRDFERDGWTVVRVLSGNGAGQVARIRGGKGRRAWISDVWRTVGASPTDALRQALASPNERMPVWFDVPDPGSRYVVVTDSRLWHDAAGQRFPAIITAGELAADKALRAGATACADRIYGRSGIEQILTRSLNLSSTDVVRLPVLFSADSEGRNAVALVTNPLNLVNVNQDVILLAPCGPRKRSPDDRSDVYLEAWSRSLKDVGLRTIAVEGWNELHRFGGGAHCGTNVLRRWSR